MADTTVAIDVVDATSNDPIAVIGVPQPCKNYEASATEVRQLIQISKYYVYEAGTKKVITGRNFNEYFPDEGGGGGGGGGEGDKSRYTIKKETAASGEVTYKLMQSINGGTSAKVGDIIGLRGNQMLVDYGGDLVILNTAITTMKEKIDAQYNFTTFTALNITTSGKTLKQITDELYAKNLPTNTIVTGQLYSPALPFSGNGEAEVMINGPAFWWTCKSLTTAPYSWNAIAGGGSWSGIKMDWTPSFPAVDTSMSDSSVNAVQNKVIKKYVDDSVYGKADASSLAAVATSGEYSDLSGTPTLSTVATSGQYSDLSGTPTIDSAMSDSSTNAVQNSTIKNYVDGITGDINSVLEEVL